MKLIEITTTTCSVCKMLAPMVKALTNSEDIELDIQIADDEEHLSAEGKKLIEEYKIKSVPVFFFIKENKVIDKHFGAISFPELKTKIKNIKNEH